MGGVEKTANIITAARVEVKCSSQKHPLLARMIYIKPYLGLA
jgi:hypothetical protein